MCLCYDRLVQLVSRFPKDRLEQSAGVPEAVSPLGHIGQIEPIWTPGQTKLRKVKKSIITPGHHGASGSIGASGATGQPCPVGAQ